MSYAVLDGLYVIHDELGSGGFGKVKLATHILTGLKVAIKIIDKKAIGVCALIAVKIYIFNYISKCVCSIYLFIYLQEDLPRVTTEMDALRTLSHQNICRLYQYIETEDKFFIVMELKLKKYCMWVETLLFYILNISLHGSGTRSPVSIGSGGDARTPRSATKTPRLRQRVMI
uniref:Protein kinase domain-containing protein n=1 Tax=Heterorhabditis bacteriophora TaxID=37862 RepID=A0A1I7W7X8_HETBA